MNRRRKWGIYGAVALVAASGGLWLGWQQFNPAPADLDAAAQKLLTQTLPDAAGQPQALAQWRGKVLVVNFWASWCAPCVEEMPELAALHWQFKDQGVQFVGIGIDSARNIEEFLSKNKGVDYPLLVSGFAGVSSMRSLGNPMGSLPFTLVIDRQGKIQHQRLGPIHKQDLTAWIHEVMAQP